MILPISVAWFGSGIRASLVHVILERRSTDQRESQKNVKKWQHPGLALHADLFLKSWMMIKLSNLPESCANQWSGSYRLCGARIWTSSFQMEHFMWRFGTPSKLTDAFFFSTSHFRHTLQNSHPTCSLQPTTECDRAILLPEVHLG